jgi:hypothetical protein
MFAGTCQVGVSSVDVSMLDVSVCGAHRIPVNQREKTVQGGPITGRYPFQAFGYLMGGCRCFVGLEGLRQLRQRILQRVMMAGNGVNDHDGKNVSHISTMNQNRGLASSKVLQC